jgi:molybdopterin/thiamine biosynthesis adenylyltransferase
MSSLEIIHDCFIRNGFIRVSSKADLPESLTGQFENYKFIYTGNIATVDGKYSVEALICFEYIPFTNWPKCFICNPESLIEVSKAHIESDNSYCYIDSEVNNLDISRPLESLLFSLACIQKQLALSFSGANKGDVALELPSYLNNENVTEFYNDKSNDFDCIEYEQVRRNKYVIRPKDLSKDITSLLWQPENYRAKRSLGLTVIKLDSPPDNFENLPLNSFRGLIDWLLKNQPNVIAKLTPILFKNIKNKNLHSKQALLFQYDINEDSINFLIVCSFSSSGLKLIKGTSAKRLRKVIGSWNDQLCTKYFYTSKIINVNPIDGVVRNIPERNLLNKSIALIGAGTLGGYVAEQMANLGAGLSTGNKAVKLDIFDYGILEPDNLSRHVLGYNSLWQNKSIELANKLIKEHPLLSLSVNGQNLKITPKNINLLKKYDLIINATGDQHTSDTLNYLWHSEEINKPIIHGWIEGGGLGARAIRLHDKTSCFRCLRHLDNSPRYRIFKDETEQPIVRKGCGISYMPFPPTVSIRSASMLVEVALNAVHSPKENYIYFDSMSEKLVTHTNKKLTRYKKCPVCS